MFVEIGAGTQSVVKNLFEGLTLYIYFQINPSAVEIVPLAVVKSPVGSIVEIEFELFDKHLYKFLSDVKIYIGRLLPLTESAVNSVSIKILSSNCLYLPVDQFIRGITSSTSLPVIRLAANILSHTDFSSEVESTMEFGEASFAYGT